MDFDSNRFASINQSEEYCHLNKIKTSDPGACANFTLIKVFLNLFFSLLFLRENSWTDFFFGQTFLMPLVSSIFKILFIHF